MRMTTMCESTSSNDGFTFHAQAKLVVWVLRRKGFCGHALQRILYTIVRESSGTSCTSRDPHRATLVVVRYCYLEFTSTVRYLLKKYLVVLLLTTTRSRIRYFSFHTSATPRASAPATYLARPRETVSLIDTLVARMVIFKSQNQVQTATRRKVTMLL